MNKDQFAAVMYHYVRDEDGLHALSTSDFRSHVRNIQSRWRIVSTAEALEANQTTGKCILTFDDGLKDSISNILPIFKELGAKGLFFISTQTLVSKKLLHVQKRHLLLRAIGSNALVTELNALLPEELQIRADPAFKADYLDDLLTCSLKWMLDFLDPELIQPALSTVFQKHLGSEEAAFDKLYLSKDDVKILLGAGMEIGAHGHSHKQLGILKFKEQEEEISSSHEILSKIVGERPLSFSYPSGSYNPLAQRLLEKYKFSFGFTTIKHLNDNMTPKYTLGRFDCKDSLPV